MLSRNIVGIASITPRTLINVVLVLFVVSFGSVGCGDDSSPAAPSTTTPPTTPAAPPTPPAAPVTLTGLALFGPRAFVDSGTVEIGDTVQLNVDAEYSDNTTKRVTDEATWTSSNDHVATVVNGLVTARNVGGFNIRAAYEDQTIRSSGYRVERPVYDIRVSNVIKYNTRIATAHWIYYSVTGLRPTPSFDLTVRIYWLDGTFTNCEELILPLQQNESTRELTIPSVCGRDTEWGSVEFIPPSGIRCEGCMRYRAGDLPFGSSLLPDEAQRLEREAAERLRRR